MFKYLQENAVDNTTNKKLSFPLHHKFLRLLGFM